MQELMQLKQSSCDSLTDYLSEFRVLAGRAGVTQVETFRHFFLKGLNQGLMRAILQDELPTTNADLMKKAVTKQQNFEEMKTLQSYYSGKTNQKTNQKKKTRYIPSRDPDAMEVDRLTEEERKEHIKKGQCFRCHRTGHTSRDCPSKGDDRKKKTDGKGKKPVRRQAPEEEQTESKVEEIEDSDDYEEVETRRADF
jgi:hypothetical protein